MMQKACKNCQYVTYYVWMDEESSRMLRACKWHQHTTLNGKNYCNLYTEKGE